MYHLFLHGCKYCALKGVASKSTIYRRQEMKQYERWQKKVLKHEYSPNVPRGAEMGWKAALEWVLTHKKPIKYNNYKFDYIKTDVIEEELNATSEKRC